MKTSSNSAASLIAGMVWVVCFVILLRQRGVEVTFHLLFLPHFKELLRRGWFRVGDSDNSRSSKITCN